MQRENLLDKPKKLIDSKWWSIKLLYKNNGRFAELFDTNYIS